MLFKTGEGGKHLIDFKYHNVTPKSLFLIHPGQLHHLKRKPNENGIVLQFNQSSLINSLQNCKIDYFKQLREISKVNLSNDLFSCLNNL